MSGRPNNTWMETMIDRLGSRKAVTERMRTIGAIGGKNGHTSGFYANRDLARVAGAIGGSISRKGKNKLNEKQRREICRAYEELLKVHTKAKQQRQAYTYA